MKVPEIRPGRRSPAARLRRQIRSRTPGSGPLPRLGPRAIAAAPGVATVRLARRTAGTVLPGAGPTARLRRRTRAVPPRLRQADWPALGSFALSLAAAPRRRGPSPKLVVGVTGALGAGAAAAAVARRKSNGAAEPAPAERTDRDIGGPTGPANPDQSAAEIGGAHGTRPNPRFEPHS
jgi:hypothetical protein